MDTIDTTAKQADLKIALSKLSIGKDDVIIFKFPINMDQVTLQASMNTIKDAFPDNLALGLVDDTDVLVQSPAEAIDMLERMIAKIKLLQGTPKPGLII